VHEAVAPHRAAPQVGDGAPVPERGDRRPALRAVGEQPRERLPHRLVPGCDLPADDRRAHPPQRYPARRGLRSGAR
jgi:hypothetical protein